MTQDNKCQKDFFNSLVCEGDDCGSPSYGHAEPKWIFETNRSELRVVCQGCGHVQSREYSEQLIAGKIQEPIYTGMSWIHPDDDDYQEALHYSQHEKLLEIVGLPQKQIHVSAPKRYS